MGFDFLINRTLYTQLPLHRPYTMSSLLRQPAHLARLSRQSLGVCSKGRPLSLRPASLPRPTYAYQRVRRYATQPEEPKKDGEKVDKKPGAPAKGMEHLYNKSGPMSPEQGDGKTSTSRPGFSKLTPEEEKELSGLFEHVKKGMPQAMTKDVEKVFQKLREDGIPQELRDTMEEVKKGTMTPATAAKLWRQVSSMARKTFEAELKEDDAAAGQQKSGAHDPGAGKSKSKTNKDGENPFTEIKLDLNTILISVFSSYLLYRLVVPGENTREITWQEFRNTFLDKGLVEKLVVINNSRVRVYLHREAVAAMYPERYVFTLFLLVF